MQFSKKDLDIILKYVTSRLFGDKLSDYPELENLTGEELLPVIQNGYNRTLLSNELINIPSIRKAINQQIVTSGSTTIGPDGYWYVDGIKTDIKAQGEPGKDGQDGKDGMAPIVKLSENGMDILISSDGGETWFKLIPDFSKVRVLGYVDSLAQLPSNAVIGDIYGVWNQEAQSGQGAYELYINTVVDWILDGNILKVYEYETELPQVANDGTVVVVEERDLTLDKEKIDGYKVYKYSIDNDGWVMILNTSEIFVSKENILNHGDNVYALVQGEEANKYQLYKRKTDWVYFGTNASITYHLIQDVEEGTDINVVSGKAVKDGLENLHTQITEEISEATTFETGEKVTETGIDGEITDDESQNLVRTKAVTDRYGKYIENPEFIEVHLDAQERILWGLRTDGTVYYGAGCPPQVQEYINKKIDEIIGIGDLTEDIDTLKEIVDFLESFKNSETLKNILEAQDAKIDAIDLKKVDKEEGKSLINEEYANGIHYIENPEFIAVWLTSDDRILFGLQRDGNFLFGCGIPRQIEDFVNEKYGKVTDLEAFLAGFEIYATLKDYLDETYGKYTDNPEFVEVNTDGEDKILYGVRKNGDFIVGNTNLTAVLEELNKLGIGIDTENGILTIGGKRFKLIAYED